MRLPSHLHWNAQDERLSCSVCAPAHTIPLWYPFEDDENVRDFVERHRHCSTESETANVTTAAANQMADGEAS